MAAVSSGCALCCSPFDHNYAAYGTRVNRVDQQHGRVGSIFSDPSVTPASGVVLEETPVIESEPSEYEELPAEGEDAGEPIPTSSGVYLGEPETLSWDE